MDITNIAQRVLGTLVTVFLVTLTLVIVALEVRA